MLLLGRNKSSDQRKRIKNLDMYIYNMIEDAVAMERIIMHGI